MTPVTMALLAFVCIFAGALLGIALRGLLPDHHLSSESKDAVKLGIGMIATLTALVLGLLTGSAKGTFDTLTGELRQVSAKIIVLDRAMAQYGPETKEAREYLRSAITTVLQRMWPEEANVVALDKLGQSSSKDSVEVLQDKLRQLTPQNDAQRSLQARALQLSDDIAEARALLVQQAGRGSLPMPFVVILVFWLIMIFASFGMFSTRNTTVIVAFLVCALSVAGSLYLILELDHPYQGLIKISSAPLKSALVQLGR